eukprot:817166-Pyramimonas_sp.AAC.1
MPWTGREGVIFLWGLRAVLGPETARGSSEIQLRAAELDSAPSETRLGASRVLGAVQAVFGASRASLRAVLGPAAAAKSNSAPWSWIRGPLGALLSPSWGPPGSLLEPSWAPIGAPWGPLGALSSSS